MINPCGLLLSASLSLTAVGFGLAPMVMPAPANEPDKYLVPVDSPPEACAMKAIHNQLRDTQWKDLHVSVRTPRPAWRSNYAEFDATDDAGTKFKGFVYFFMDKVDLENKPYQPARPMLQCLVPCHLVMDSFSLEDADGKQLKNDRLNWCEAGPGQ